MPIRIEDQTTDRDEPAFLVLTTETEGEVLWTFSRGFIAREIADRVGVFIERLEPEKKGTIFVLPANKLSETWQNFRARRGELETVGATLPLYKSALGFPDARHN